MFTSNDSTTTSATDGNNRSFSRTARSSTAPNCQPNHPTGEQLSGNLAARPATPAVTQRGQTTEPAPEPDLVNKTIRARLLAWSQGEVRQVEKSEAKRLLERARQAWEAEERLRSAELYEQVLAHYPDEEPSAVWWYDAALAYKFLRNWAKAYELGCQAAARSPRGEQDPAFWNLGVAATIQRDWVTARDAWEGFGIPIPQGEGEINGSFGMACVRLDTGGRAGGGVDSAVVPDAGTRGERAGDGRTPLRRDRRA